MSMRDQIISIIEDNNVGELNRERVDMDAAADAILAMPEISNAQAKIAELENALAAASGTIAAMREGGADDEGVDAFWAAEGSHYGSGG